LVRCITSSGVEPYLVFPVEGSKVDKPSAFYLELPHRKDIEFWFVYHQPVKGQKNIAT